MQGKQVSVEFLVFINYLLLSYATLICLYHVNQGSGVILGKSKSRPVRLTTGISASVFVETSTRQVGDGG